MPELPEVENFRQLLLPLIGDELSMETHGVYPRVNVSELIDAQSTGKNAVVCTDVVRRGKQICLVLSVSQSTKYLFLHMGMTGRIKVYGKSENWGERKDGETSGHSEIQIEDDQSLPKYTCLVFSSVQSKYTAFFCDPRKFGSAYIASNLNDLDSLAPDALTCTDPETIQGHILPALTNQRLGIKAILLDQKRATSGVGNWVADEVLYQCRIHPDQTKLDVDEATLVFNKLQEIVSIAVKSLADDLSYPDHWLFHYRWTGKKAGKDAEGRSISFITSGGRTTAIINTMQKLSKRSTPPKTSLGKIKGPKNDLSSNDTDNVGDADPNQPLKRKPRKRAKAMSTPDSTTSDGTKASDATVEQTQNLNSTTAKKIKYENKNTSKTLRGKVADSGQGSATNRKSQKVSSKESLEVKTISRRTSPRLVSP
jgi:formamidopyrimidine-DNA glycosylase